MQNYGCRFRPNVEDAEWLEKEVLSQIHLLCFSAVDINPEKSYSLFPF